MRVNARASSGAGVRIAVAAVALMAVGCGTASSSGGSAAATGQASAGTTVTAPTSGGTVAVRPGDAVPAAPPSQQTDPRVRPTRGSRSTSFTLRLTARQQLGVQGVVSSDYRVVLVGPRPRRPAGCGAASPPLLNTGRAGQTLTVALRPGHGGWCDGGYRGVVLLDSGPYCPKPTGGGLPRPCPEFASQSLDVGRFVFRVAG